MSLSFACPHCGAAITVTYLHVGDPFLCRSCQFRGTVPADAVASGETSTLLQHAPSLQHLSPDPQPTPMYYHGYALAGRGQRLLARIAENVIFAVGYLLTFVIGARFLDQERFVIYWFVMIGIGLAVTLVVQAYLLGTRSQSLGKLIVGIKIIRFGTGRDAGLTYGFFVREFLNRFLTLIPFYGLIDVLFIFTDEKRCVHDHLAGTIVVKCPDR